MQASPTLSTTSASHATAGLQRRVNLRRRKSVARRSPRAGGLTLAGLIRRWSGQSLLVFLVIPASRRKRCQLHFHKSVLLLISEFPSRKGRLPSGHLASRQPALQLQQLLINHLCYREPVGWFRVVHEDRYSISYLLCQNML